MGLCGLSKLLGSVVIEVLASLLDSMLDLKEVIGYFHLSRAETGEGSDRTRSSARKGKRVCAELQSRTQHAYSILSTIKYE